MREVKFQAHRGVSTEYPENTMSAFKGAICQGYSVIELDPDVTADGRIVLLHDRTINRTGRKADGGVIEETVNIGDITYEEALGYDFGLWFSNKFRGERIPLLSQALAFGAENDVLIKIDGKLWNFKEKDREELFRQVRESGARTAITCGKMEGVKTALKEVPAAEIHYDGAVTEEILKELVALVPAEKLTVWLPYKNRLTSWWVKIPFADRELCALVKQYATLGIWILEGYDQRDDAVENLQADIIETTGSIKPVRRFGMRADVHMHSEFSDDCRFKVSEMCQSAREKGLDVICITDHCHTAFLKDTEYLKNSVQSAREENKVFFPKPEVLAGVEIGEGFWRPEVSEKVIHGIADYDQIIGSIHVTNYGGKPTAYSGVDFSAYTDEQIQEFLDLYFDDVMRLLTESECDVLAHLTNPLKYICGKQGRTVDLSRHQEKIDRILEYIIKHGIALEINASIKGRFEKYDELMPCEEIIKRYAQMGGYLVTMAGDAHNPDSVFRHGEFVIETLKKYGFKNMFYFKKRFSYQYTIAD